MNLATATIQPVFYSSPTGQPRLGYPSVDALFPSYAACGQLICKTNQHHQEEAVQESTGQVEALSGHL